MNKKMEIFADKYIECLDGQEAATFAGYSERTARIRACELLKREDVKEYIKVRMEEKNKNLVASQDEILQYLTNVMRGDDYEEIYLVEGEGEGYSRAKKYDRQVATKDRLKAAELLGKRYALYTEKIETADEIKIVISSKKDNEN